eukprot:ANDGO_07004.mRNA.1 MDIS1-interacting receptor like kinase 2
MGGYCHHLPKLLLFLTVAFYAATESVQEALTSTREAIQRKQQRRPGLPSREPTDGILADGRSFFAASSNKLCGLLKRDFGFSQTVGNATWWHVLRCRFSEKVVTDVQAAVASFTFDMVNKIASTAHPSRMAQSSSSPDVVANFQSSVLLQDSATSSARRASQAYFSSFEEDCLALWSIYETTNGTGWRNQTGWNLGREYIRVNCCSGEVYGVTCDQNGRVTALVLSDNRLAGAISRAISQLSAITNVDLNTNSLYGVIPPVFQKFPALRFLDLSSNLLSGGFPAFANDSQLNHLDLAANELEGPLPEMIGELKSLSHLDLSSNSFSGTIPSALGRLQQLQTLNLFSNRFTGPITFSFTGMTQLQTLNLRMNFLDSWIPDGIRDLSGLQRLDFSSNRFSGSIPLSIGNLTNIIYLDLSSNLLESSIPDNIGQLVQLETLDLSSNRLSGPVPGSFLNLGKLLVLHLYSNLLNGSIIVPDLAAKLPHLQDLQIQNNFLSGNIVDFSLPKDLVTLNARLNEFSGPLHESLCNLTNLKFLYISSNRLTAFPNCSLPQLVNLDLSANQLSQFPFDRISEFSSLISLDLSLNLLEGDFPRYLFQQGLSLRSLSLARNSFQGAFPLWLCANSSPMAESANQHLTGLIDLDLSGNNITGAPGIFSTKICDTRCPTLYVSLSVLVMSSSSLPSIFPSYSYVTESGKPCTTAPYPPTAMFANLPSLRRLVLRDNGLSVGLDRIFDDLPVLNEVDISGNADARKNSLSTANQRLFSFDPSSAYPYNREIICYKANIRSYEWQVEQLEITADPSFYDFKNCLCRPGFYRKPPHCIPCMSEHAVCSFDPSTDLSTLDPLLAYNQSGNVVPKPGYYPSPNVPLPEMERDERYPVTIEICPNAGTDITPCQSTSTSVCIRGYQGRLCTSCEQGYFRTGDRCVSCPSRVGLVLFALLVFTVICCVVAWSFFVGSSSSGVFKILLFFIQALYYLRAPMPVNLYVITNSSTSLSNLSFAGPECFFKDWSHTESFVVAVTAPVVSGLIVFGIWAVRASWFKMRRCMYGVRLSSRQWNSWIDRSRRSAIFLFTVLFSPAISAVLAPLSCAKDMGDGESYLRYYPDVKCSATMQIAASLFLLFYGVCVPGTLIFLVRRSDVLKSSTSQHSRRMYVYSLLFDSYRKGCRWWEILVTVRRILFVAAYVTISRLSQFRTVLVSIVLSAATVFQATAIPYGTKTDNIAESTSLALLLVNLLCSIQSDVLGIFDVETVGIILFSLNLGFVGVLSFVLTLHLRKHVIEYFATRDFRKIVLDNKELRRSIRSLLRSGEP